MHFSRYGHRPHSLLWQVALASCLLLTLLGCNRQPPEVTDEASPAQPTAVAAELPAEVWDVFYIAGTKVGFGHTSFEQKTDGTIVTTAEHNLEMQRFRQTVKQKITLTSTLDADGKLVSCYSKVESGTQPITTTGQVKAGKLQLTTNSQGNETSSAIKWKQAWGGFFASDHSLLAQPMKPGEKRMIKSLAAIFNQVSTTELTAGGWEETDMLDGKQNLLRIEQKTTIGSQTIPSTVWMSKTGQAMKVFVPGIRQTSYRTTKERALRSESGGTFDLAEMTIVKVSQRFEDPHRTLQVKYRATLSEGNPAKVFLSGTSQEVKPIDEHTAEITVHAVRPDHPPETSKADEQPTEADLAANSLIQADDARIVRMANTVLPKETDRWKLARALETYVRRVVKSKNFSQAFATAAEVAESLEGDCTEHAVLLAALCRARQLPARVAIGLVYFPQAGGYAYHMWSEVWIEDRWIPLDGTLAYGGIGGGHLKIAHSNLAGVDAYSVFLPAQQVIGQLDLKVLAVEQGGE